MDGEPNVALLYHHSEISKHLKGRFEEPLVTLWPSLVLDGEHGDVNLVKIVRLKAFLARLPTPLT